MIMSGQYPIGEDPDVPFDTRVACSCSTWTRPKHTRYRLLVNKGFTPRMIGLIEQALHHRAQPHRRQRHRAAARPTSWKTSPPSCRCRRSPRSWASRRRTAASCSSGRTAWSAPAIPSTWRTTPARRSSSCSPTSTGSASAAARRPARRHRHQAPQRRDRGRAAQRARVRHVHDAAGGRGQRDHAQRDRARHVRAPHQPRAVRAARSATPKGASTTRSRRSCAGRRRCCTSAAPRPTDTEIRGRAIKAGDRVVIWHISANRDEEVWDDPFVFDITRNPNPHVAFGGGGSHFCLGANLARMELKLILSGARHAAARHAAGGRAAAAAVELHRRHQAHAGEVDAGTAGPRRRLSGSGGILSGPIDGPARTAAQYPHREATPGLRVLHRASGFTGALVALDGDEVVLRGHTGLEKRYRNLPGTFAVDGTPTHLVPVRVPVGRRRPRVSPRACAPRRAAGAVVGAQGARRARQPDLGRGRARRRAGRAGLGRRPAHRGHRGRAPRRRRPPGRRGARVRSRPRTPPRRAARPPGRREQGSPPGRRGAPPARAGDRNAVRRRVAGGATVGGRHRRVAGRPEGPGLEDRSVRRARASTTRGPCGGGSSASVHDWKQLEQPFVAAVEQLIDFLTE